MAGSQNPYSWQPPIDMPGDGPPSGQILRLAFQSLSSWIAGVTTLPVFFKGLRVGNGTPPVFDSVTGRQTADAPLASLAADANGGLSVNGVSLSGDPAWTNFTLPGPWSAGADGAPAYRKVGTRVWLRGQAHAAVGQAAGTLVCTLPAGYRPPAHQWLPAVHNGVPSFVEITAAGAINVGVPTAGANPVDVFLNSVSFDTLA